MSESDPGRDRRGEVEPGVFLLPFALLEPVEFGDLASDVLARRLPDLLHQLLNGTRPGTAGMLEIQSSPDDGPPRWVTLSDVPSPDEVFPMLGGVAADVLVAGALRRSDQGVLVDLAVHMRDGDAEVEHGVHALVRVDDPAGSVLRLAEHLAQVLSVPFRRPGPNLLTRVPEAFFRFLEALDGAAILSAEPDLESERIGADLLQPLADALRLDPGFGLALRTLAQVLFPALLGERVPKAICQRILDACLQSGPRDGEGCVEVAERLALCADQRRARAWLEHASRLDPPPARALESLGVHCANDGDLASARTLWERGLELEGHPDFFAHLGRLALSDGRESDAWDALGHGLRRKLERSTRAAEWDDDGRGPSVLLRYLAEHLGEVRCPDALIGGIEALAGRLDDPAERVDLALCLSAAGRGDLAEPELRAALVDELPAEVEDRAVRAMLGIAVPDFEGRFKTASESAANGRDPRGALVEMQACLERQPGFWPALYYAGVALRRLGRDHEALDLMAEVVHRRPGQTDALVEMAEMFDSRGNPKRALECVDEALGTEPEDVDLRLLRAQCLEHLGRASEASAELERAIALEPGRRGVGRARRRRHA